MVRFGISLPQVERDSPYDVGRLHRFLATAERLGYESGWVLEQPIGRAPTLEPLALLAHAAAVTSTLRLGTAVILTPLRVPVELAKAFSTIDQLSGGRVIAGMALGAWQDRYPAFGIRPAGRVRRFEEAVTLIKRLWTEPSVTAEGEFWQLRDAALEPKPVQQPRPPVWFGGTAAAAVQRAARMADGWIGAGSVSTADFRTAHEALREALNDEGRETASFDVAKRVYVALDDDRDRARSRLDEWFGLFYARGDMADRVAVFGPAQACVEGLAEVVDAGARMVAINPVFDQERQAEAFAADVLPALRDR